MYFRVHTDPLSPPLPLTHTLTHSPGERSLFVPATPAPIMILRPPSFELQRSILASDHRSNLCVRARVCVHAVASNAFARALNIATHPRKNLNHSCDTCHTTSRRDTFRVRAHTPHTHTTHPPHTPLPWSQWSAGQQGRLRLSLQDPVGASRPFTATTRTNSLHFRVPRTCGVCNERTHIKTSYILLLLLYIMIFRTTTGELITIQRTNYITDAEYYKHIMKTLHTNTNVSHSVAQFSSLRAIEKVVPLK